VVILGSVLVVGKHILEALRSEGKKDCKVGTEAVLQKHHFLYLGILS
jgi:hypothetical protein